MALIKHSERTIRSGCKSCGRKDLYWAHDTDREGEGFACATHASSGKMTLIEVDGTRHNCRNRPAPESAPSLAPQVTPPSPAPMPAPNGTDPGRLATAAALIDALTPKVDAETVRSMVAESQQAFTAELDARVQAKIDSITAPVVVHVKTETETREIPGLTHMAVPKVLTVLNAGEHCLMVGPAGTGKSTIAEQCAEALGLGYFSISLSPQTPASALLGYMQAAGEYVRSLYREAYESGGVFHFDEFDNAHPSVLAVINASLANGHMAFPDRMVKRHPSFRVCASANTYGRGPDRQYVGRQALDAATLDRFSIVAVEIDNALESELCKLTGAASNVVTEVLSYVRGLRANADTHKMALIFSPRASVGMCRLINAGLPVNEAIESRARRGISDADWSKVTSGVALPRL